MAQQSNEPDNNESDGGVNQGSEETGGQEISSHESSSDTSSDESSSGKTLIQRIEALEDENAQLLTEVKEVQGNIRRMLDIVEELEEKYQHSSPTEDSSNDETSSQEDMILGMTKFKFYGAIVAGIFLLALLFVGGVGNWNEPEVPSIADPALAQPVILPSRGGQRFGLETLIAPGSSWEGIVSDYSRRVETLFKEEGKSEVQIRVVTSPANQNEDTLRAMASMIQAYLKNLGYRHVYIDPDIFAPEKRGSGIDVQIARQ